MGVIRTDFLVIGSGIAGLTYALNVAEKGSVLIITKGDADESNTKYAQGGIAAVTATSDSFEKHVQDTLKAGDGLCDEHIVRMVVEEAPAIIESMVTWGTKFDTTSTGSFDLAKEGGHSEFRILHHKDNTGYELERSLLEQIKLHPNITITTHYFAIDLITQHHLNRKDQQPVTCFGTYAMDLRTGTTVTILAKITMLATGGAGNVYMNTTNPVIATGDGIAMVNRAGGDIAGMEFIQFHPTALYHPGERPSFLISEAVRGMGAELKTQDGKAFMYKYDERSSLASRDIVARAIDNELHIRGERYVHLDCIHLDKDAFKTHFPNILEKCLSIGVDPVTHPIPVVPAAHYTCGGVSVDRWGRSSVANLFATGECASTGLHGANRLASNSLLEAAVFTKRASEKSMEMIGDLVFAEGVPDWSTAGTSKPEEMALITHSITELQEVMSNYAGIVKSNKRLARAATRLKIISEETGQLYRYTVLSVPLMELRNMVEVAKLIVSAARARKENRGLHYNVDLI